MERVLSRLDYAYEGNGKGGFRVEVPLNAKQMAVLGVSSHSQETFKGVNFCSIWPVFARIPGNLASGLPESLMSDSWSFRKAGSWVLAGQSPDGRKEVIYRVKMLARSGKQVWKAAIRDAAESAADMATAISDLEGY